MKCYVITTGLIFGLISVAHIARIFAEGPALAKEPWFILMTILAIGLCIWAFRLVKSSPPS